MNKLSLALVGLVCTSMIGCSVEGNCDYKAEEPLNNYKCENNIPYVCNPADNIWDNDSANNQTDDKGNCSFGCDEKTNRCKKNNCNANKCENGKLTLCKSDKSGYELDDNGKEITTTCPLGCNKEGTDCNQSCTTDVCTGAQIYRCNDGTLTSPDDCPEIAGSKGSCANGTTCMQCNESLNRRCISPTEYNLCVSGLWSEEKHSCPDKQFCSDSVDGCTEEMKNSCINNASGTGQIWTYVNGELKAEECPHEASCSPDGKTCGECLIQEDTKCENGDYYICNNGKFEKSACSEGLGCHTDATQAHKKGICNECVENKCEKSTGSSEVGVLTKCINHVWDEDSETCEADGGKYVSCQSKTQCGVCKNNAIRCKDENTKQVCENGKWVNSKCDGENQICDTKTNTCVDNPNICTLGKKRCKPGDKDTPQTIIEECKESKGKRYWEVIKTCTDNTPLCVINFNTPSCVECDPTAVTNKTGNAYNGYRCNPSDEHKRQYCQVNQWKDLLPQNFDCNSDEVCEEKSTVAQNDKGEYFTIWDAQCVKKN